MRLSLKPRDPLPIADSVLLTAIYPPVERMAAYGYSAIDAQGLELRGEIHAPDPEAAREQLRMRGMLAQWLNELPAEGEDGIRTVFKKVKPKSLQIFSRQFATMIDAGLSVVGALVILEQQTDDKYLSAVISELRADVEGGLLLSQAMARHPKIFNRLYVAMVEAGEAAGILDQVLDRVAFQIEKETQIKRRVKGAMIYPTMVLIFATLVLIGMLLFLVPIFVEIFATLGGDLPTLTQYVVAMSDFLKANWMFVFPGLAIAFFGFRRLKKTEHGRQLWDRFKLRAPMKIGARRPQGDDRALLAHPLDPRSPRALTSSRRSRSPARRPATGSSRRRSRTCAPRCTQGRRSPSRSSRTRSSRRWSATWSRSVRRPESSRRCSGRSPTSTRTRSTRRSRR